MAEFTTLSEMLAAQGERKLTKLRDGIRDEINRLGTELRIVDEALSRKRREKSSVASRSDEPRLKSAQTVPGDGLARADLLKYIIEMKRREVTPPEVQKYLIETKGIARNVEAVRTGMTRLVKDGALRRENGHFAVVSMTTVGVEVEPGGPLWGTELETEGVATPEG